MTDQEIRPMLVASPIHIKGYEIDVMGIVSNIVYVKWFEDLRHLLLDKHYPFNDMLADNKSPMLMKTEVEYKRPLTILDNPVGKLWFSRLGRMKWEISFEISVGETIHCTGKQTGCFFDLKKKAPAPFPDWFLEKYRQESQQIN